VLIQGPHDFLRLRQFGGERLLPALHVLRDDVVAEVHALIADVNGGSRDQFSDLFAALAAEGTSSLGVGFLLFCDQAPLPAARVQHRRGLCVSSRTFRSASRLPFVPAARGMDPMRPAWPTQIVAMDGLTYCIV